MLLHVPLYIYEYHSLLALSFGSKSHSIFRNYEIGGRTMTQTIGGKPLGVSSICSHIGMSVWGGGGEGGVEWGPYTNFHTKAAQVGEWTYVNFTPRPFTCPLGVKVYISLSKEFVYMGEALRTDSSYLLHCPQLWKVAPLVVWCVAHTHCLCSLILFHTNFLKMGLFSCSFF